MYMLSKKKSATLYIIGSGFPMLLTFVLSNDLVVCSGFIVLFLHINELLFCIIEFILQKGKFL